MRLKIAMAMLAVAGVVGVGAHSASDEIAIPESDGLSGLCEPFDCSTRIQQVYDAALFPAKIRIEALELFNYFDQGSEGFVEPAHYQFFLSTTAASSSTLSIDMDANLGSHEVQIADFTISDFETRFKTAWRFTFPKHFMFNPREGNLLLENRKDQSARYGDGTIYVDGNTEASGVAIVTPLFGVVQGLGMTTGFVGKFLGPFTSASLRAPIPTRPAAATALDD